LRGGLATKAYLAIDGNGRGLAVVLTAGQVGDSSMMSLVLDAIAVPRLTGGLPRCRPEKVLANKAYSSASNRPLLRSKGIRTVIPERAVQIANRKRRGRAGGWPTSFDSSGYKGRNVVERAFDKAKHWRGVATRYDKLALTYRAGFVMGLTVEWLKLLGDMT
jgi:transposase